MPTLFAVCFLYPDGDGGNLSTNRSASSDVGASDVQRAAQLFAAHPGRGVALALPEVPLAARRALLELATAHGWLRVAGVVPDELEQVRDSGLLGLVDVLALNIEEAATLGGVSVERPAAEVVGGRAAGAGRPAQPGTGRRDRRRPGQLDLGRSRPRARPGVRPGGEVVSTAGAGDAHLSGVVVGLVAGLELAPANAFASIVSGLKVRSPHTINPDIDPRAVVDAAARRGLVLPTELFEALAGAST